VSSALCEFLENCGGHLPPKLFHLSQILQSAIVEFRCKTVMVAIRWW